jgi:hypothetical protein
VSSDGALAKALGPVWRGLVLLLGTDIDNADAAHLHDALELLAIQGRLIERARRKILKELTDRAFVRAMRSSNEQGGAPCAL